MHKFKVGQRVKVTDWAGVLESNEPIPTPHTEGWNATYTIESCEEIYGDEVYILDPGLYVIIASCVRALKKRKPSAPEIPITTLKGEVDWLDKVKKNFYIGNTLPPSFRDALVIPTFGSIAEPPRDRTPNGRYGTIRVDAGFGQRESQPDIPDSVPAVTATQALNNLNNGSPESVVYEDEFVPVEIAPGEIIRYNNPHESSPTYSEDEREMMRQRGSRIMDIIREDEGDNNGSR